MILFRCLYMHIHAYFFIHMHFPCTYPPGNWHLPFERHFWVDAFSFSRLVGCHGCHGCHVIVRIYRYHRYDSIPKDPITLSDDDWGVLIARYLGSITILRRWARIPREWTILQSFFCQPWSSYHRMTWQRMIAVPWHHWPKIMTGIPPLRRFR